MIVQGYSVEPLKRKREFVEDLEAKMHTVPSLLDGADRSLWSLVSEPGSAFFTVASYDYVGLIGITGATYGKYADAHITFWDRKLEDKAVVCKDVAAFIMESAGLELLLSHIPTNRKRLVEFAKVVGFETFRIDNGVTSLALLKEKEKWESS